MSGILLKVKLWGREVGRLQWIDYRKVACFSFNPDYLKDGWNLAPLTASVEGEKALYPLFGMKSAPDTRIFQGLPPFLADSLPDAWGNELFDKWAAENHLSASDKTPVDKLAFIGRRGMGALEFEPAFDFANELETIALQSLCTLAEKIFNDRNNAIITAEETLTLKSLVTVGTSAGGRQAKAIVAIAPDGTIKSGQVAGLERYKYCILKFGNAFRQTAELEKTYHDMAVSAGIDMMPSSLICVEGIQHFLTERFDRPNGEKLHTQTLAAMSPDAQSYEDLFLVCRRIGISEKEQTELFRRLAFNVLSNNTDDHVKNFSFMMNTKGEWHITPAYDLTFVFAADGVNPEKHHCLSVGGKTNNIAISDLMAFAKNNGVKRPESIINKVAQAVSSFRTMAIENGVSTFWVNCIEEHLSGLVPQPFNSTMLGWKAADLASVIKGRNVCHVHFEMSPSGNIHLCATIDGKEQKYVFNQQRAEFQKILSKGFNTMPDEAKLEYVESFLLKE